MNKEKIKIHFRNKIEMVPLPIISDAIIARKDLADGRMIPLLIIDTSHRPDVKDMIKAHELTGAGDVESIWFFPSRFDRRNVNILLIITKPSKCLILLEFNVLRHGGVVDQIIHSQGLYLQSGNLGDRLSTTIDHERLLIEIPSKHFKNEWDNVLRKTIFKDFKNKGLSRTEAKIATQRFIDEWRRFGSNRMCDM